jgi:Tfp pilus assembly protein PilF
VLNNVSALSVNFKNTSELAGEMMKNNKLLWKGVLALCLAMVLISCAANLEKKRQQSKAMRALGEAYLREGNYTEALKELLKAESLHPNDPLLQNDLGLAYMAKKSYDNAKEHFKKAIALKPEYASAKNNLGTAYLATEAWDDAISVFKDVLSDLLYATPHYAYSNLGLAYYNKGDYRQAEAYYLKALDVEPDFVLALRGLGRTYAAMNKMKAAIETFEKALQHAADYAELNMDLADAYQKTMQYEKALYYYRKVETLAPETPLAEEAKRKADELAK